MRKMLDYIIGTKESRDKELKGMIATSIVLAFFYYIINKYPTGWITWSLISPACLVILITALARVNDMTVQHTTWRWQMRKMGFIVAGTAAAAYLSLPFSEVKTFPTWNAVMLANGVALSWITTPNMVPWHRYITGEFRKKDLVKMAQGEKIDELSE